MGIVALGIPEQIVIDLARLSGAATFVETGTFHGGTTRWAAKHFETVHTIERAENLYNLHSRELAQIKGVKPHLGDSRTVLPQIIKDFDGGQRAVYWLDGHWSGGETAGELDECPLLDELACLSNRAEDIILIDDARLFLCAPPLPHNPSQWATVPEILDALSFESAKSFIQIIDDVIFIIPNDESIRDCLVEYAQRRANDFWAEFGKLQRGQSSSAGTRLMNFLSRIGRS